MVSLSKAEKIAKNNSKQKQNEIVRGGRDAVNKAANEAKPKKGSPKESATVVFNNIQKIHFSGSNGLPQMLDKLGDLTDRGQIYEAADGALGTFLDMVKAMHEGKVDLTDLED